MSGYTEREKLEIAKRHLIPKQCENSGIDSEKVKFTDDGILEIIRHYTREAGVRNLEREIGSCLRKIARKFVVTETKDDFRVVIDAEKVQELLGTIRFRKQDIARKSEIGLVNGLAWTEVGGDVLQVEATLVKGKGEVTLTGKLGEVMQESAKAALTCVRTRAEELGIDPSDLSRKGPSYSRARRSDPEGRPERRNHDGDGDGLGDDEKARASRCRDDRRDHASRQGFADRRR